MIYGSNNVHVLRDATDLIGIRVLILRQYWQAVGNVDSQADLDAQKPPTPPVPRGLLLMGEQTVKEKGRFATIWTFQGINGDGDSVTFKTRGKSVDYGFEPGFAQVPIQLHPDFEALKDKYEGYPSNDGASVIWPPELTGGSQGSTSGTAKDQQKPGQLNPMFGIAAYFEMEGVYRYRYAERKLPVNLFNGVGFIASGLPGEPPPVGGGIQGASYEGATPVGGGGTDKRNWLKAPPSYQRKGVVFDITEYYWLSRRGGWPDPVYRRGFNKK